MGSVNGSALFVIAIRPQVMHVILGAADLSESKASLDWSTYMVRTVLPTISSPLSGCSCPTSILNRVDLPAPLAPMIPAPDKNLNKFRYRFLHVLMTTT